MNNQDQIRAFGILNAFQKGGEGSRGGHVIGHTPKGNPIYGSPATHTYKQEESKRLAPNGKESNLSEEQYKTVRTPEFKAWFGDWEKDPENASKVLDKNGEPLVVYHGTASKFNEFKNNKIGQNYRESEGGGFFFTQKRRSAENYALLHSKMKGGVVLSCFLNVRNPIERNTNSDYYAPADHYDINRDVLIRERRASGKDGIIIKGTLKDNLIVAFNPNQIKSAENNKIFDPKSNDINKGIN